MSIKYKLISWCHCSWIKDDRVIHWSSLGLSTIHFIQVFGRRRVTDDEGTSAPHLLTPLDWYTLATSEGLSCRCSSATWLTLLVCWSIWPGGCVFSSVFSLLLAASVGGWIASISVFRSEESEEILSNNDFRAKSSIIKERHWIGNLCYVSKEKRRQAEVGFLFLDFALKCCE